MFVHYALPHPPFSSSSSSFAATSSAGGAPAILVARLNNPCVGLLHTPHDASPAENRFNAHASQK